MSKAPYMPLWVSDFLGDTLDLDAKEVGAYMLLLMAMWQRGGTLPDDEKKLRRVARVGRDWPRVWGNLRHYFTSENGTISNPRLSVELQKVDTKRRVNARSGARGGAAKALKNKELVLANATVSLKQPYPYPEEREKEIPDGISKKKRRRGTRLPEDWVLPEPWAAWALGEGFAPEVVRFETEKFRDYWVSKTGQGSTKLDWQATWRNWMRNSKGAFHGKPTGKPGNSGDRTLQLIADVARSL